METKRLQAYELMQEQELKGIQSKGYLLRHKKSGARIVLIENEDENKVFPWGLERLRRTVQDFHISWNIRCFAGQENFRPKIRSWSW